jgi:tetratricopeptide (TPR) repeat protein
MYRFALRMTAALSALGMAVALALADDRETCDEGTGQAPIDACTRLIVKNPGDVGAYINRGYAYQYGKHDYDRAFADYDQAIRLDPKNVAAYYNRGTTYQNGKRDFDRAIADYDQAIRLNPKYALAYRHRGYAYQYGKHDYDRAFADYDQAIRLDPKNAELYDERGNAYFNKGDHDKGDYDRAFADYDQAIRLDPKNAELYDERGSAYFRKADYGRAIADYDQAIRLDPSAEYARWGRERAQVMLAARSNLGTQANAPTSTPVPVAVAPSGRRIALVIGMSAYANVPPLRNPASDARSIADTFRRLGFAEVIEREDLTLASLEKVLKDFGDKAVEADWAVIYYAGHGVEMDGVNYLIPVDAKLTRAGHIEDDTVSLTRVLSKAEPARKLRMVILDACRDSPFRMPSADGRSRAIGRGLSPVEPAGGVLVAYAARHGTTADDDNSGHSPFTQALLANLETPGLEINLMFSRVRDQVLARTHNAQEPFTYGSLPGEELYFKQAAP